MEGDRAVNARVSVCADFYPRPPGGGRLVAIGCRVLAISISIHALRVEGDKPTHGDGVLGKRFLSTPSGWRATGLIVPKRPVKLNFYPRPPGGGRLVFPNSDRVIHSISIHALRVEGDRA